MDYLKKYWAIITCVASIILGYGMLQQRVNNIDARIAAIEAINIQVQLSQIQTDLQWIKQQLK